MQAVIVAGGKGSRLVNDGIKTPKILLEFDEKSLLEIQLENLIEAGYSEIICLLGFESSLIEDAIAAIRLRFDVDLRIIVETSPLGTGGSLVNVFEILEDDFLVLYGDLLIENNLGLLAKEFELSKSDLILVRPSDHVFDSDTVSIDMTGYVTAFFPKTHNRVIKRNIASTGVFYLRKDSIAVMKANFGESKFELDRDGFPFLLEKEIPIKTVFNVGFVKDIGTVDRIESARKEWQNRRNWQVPKKIIFLDRDGVIIDNLDNKADAKALRIIPGFEKAIEIFRTLDFKIYVTTNQPGLAKGFFDWNALELIHGSIDSVLSTHGLFLDGWLVCPHHPESGFSGEVQALKILCRCRKPKTLMFESVLKNQPIDKSKSWLVGDGMSDLIAADNFGINFAGIISNELKNSEASMMFATLLDFAEYISYLDNVITK